MAASDRRGQQEDGIKPFDPRILDRSVIAIPLLEEINKDENEVHAVIIDANLDYPAGRDVARIWIREAIKTAAAKIAPADEKQGVREKKSDLSNQYIFARLSGKVIRELVRLDVERAGKEAKTAKRMQPPKKRARASVKADATPYHLRAIYRIWPDFAMHYKVARDSESRCSANFILRARHRYHVGYHGFGH
jgi:serine protease AprX